MIVRYQNQVQMDNGTKQGSFSWSVIELPTAEARRRAWEYWKTCYRKKALDGKSQRIGCEEGVGPLSNLVDGKRYHGNNPNWEFTVWEGFAHSSKNSFTHRIHNRLIDTFEHQDVFCGNCTVVGGHKRAGATIFRCNGHVDGELVTKAARPAGSAGVLAPRGAEQVGVDSGPGDTVPELLAEIPAPGAASSGSAVPARAVVDGDGLETPWTRTTTKIRTS